MARIVLFFLSSDAPVKRIISYFYCAVCLSAIFSTAENKRGRLFAAIYFDWRRIRNLDFYGAFAVISFSGQKFCFVCAVLGDLDQELRGDALVLGSFGNTCAACVERVETAVPGFLPLDGNQFYPLHVRRLHAPNPEPADLSCERGPCLVNGG